MNIVVGTLWALLAAVVGPVSVKYYFPKLDRKIAKSNSEALMCPSDAGSIAGMSRFKAVAAMVLLAIIAGICGFVLASKHQNVVAVCRFSFAVAVLVFAAVCDFEYKIIPNICILHFIIARLLSIAIEVIYNREKIAVNLLGSFVLAAGCLVFLVIMSAIIKGGIGAGDIKLVSGLAFLCDLKSVAVTFIIAILLCAVISGALLILKKKGLKDTIPMGPFILIGFLLTALIV